jgi:hypothetical protein
MQDQASKNTDLSLSVPRETLEMKAYYFPPTPALPAPVPAPGVVPPAPPPPCALEPKPRLMAAAAAVGGDDDTEEEAAEEKPDPRFAGPRARST